MKTKKASESENKNKQSMADSNEFNPNSRFLQKFRLYETCSNFYMIGRDKNRTAWSVLKIDRLEPSELYIFEDSSTYSEPECCDLLKRIHEGNKPTGGLKFVTTCYGIVGFIKFLGPYYMVVITKRRKIGAICGHNIYAITKSEMIPVPNSSVRSNMTYSKNENRYKKLLSLVDLTKGFFFSYSYLVMHSLQKNLCSNEMGRSHYETMFVWNEFLTREIRNKLKSTLWTVALVYGFFKQINLSVSDVDLKLTLIARRSRHYAGTRYLKRGVNEKGRVANDVETEQIVTQYAPEGSPVQISSVVQNRGSIPLFWSQETSRLNIRPDIILPKKDPNYNATRLHFQNLVRRYGNPIIVLNLIKTREKKPRESILRREYANAIQFINEDLPEDAQLRFLHWDLNRHSRNKSINVLALLGKVADYALELTGIFHCQVISNLQLERMLSSHYLELNSGVDVSSQKASEVEEDTGCSKTDNIHLANNLTFQTGVLRTNCIDCLDRTNVAQYAYGLAALGRQLYTLEILESPHIELEHPLAEDLMRVYETMGDILAVQYTGSAAHNKIFCQKRGQWGPATHSQEFLRTIQRYYSNAYMDADKQDAINMFLGYFHPQQGKPALWELGSDQHLDVGRHMKDSSNKNPRSTMRRSFSDGNILCESESPITEKVGRSHCNDKDLSECTPEASTCESDAPYSRFTPSMPRRQLFGKLPLDCCLESDRICYDGHGNSCNCSNFVDMDRLSSSGNSCEGDPDDRSIAGLSSAATESGSSIRGGEGTATELPNVNAVHIFSESFVHWVNDEKTFFR